MSVADLAGMAEDRRAMVFREPDGRPEVVDVRVGEQERVDVVDAETELAYRVEHFVALAGEPGVDDEQAGVVGDEGPVHQVGMREVDGVGDRREGRHAPEFMQPAGARCATVCGSGVETKSWLN